MPTINIFYKDKTKEKELGQLTSQLKSYIAEKLSNKDMQLSLKEISVRLIKVDGGNMIGEVELEITAHAFPERIAKQDEICNEVREYIQKAYPSIGKIRVWLILAELGHSW